MRIKNLMISPYKTWRIIKHVCILCCRVNNLSSKRKKDLDVAKTYFEFMQNSEEEERWVQEKIGIVKQADTGKDLNAACVLLKRHEVCCCW